MGSLGFRSLGFRGKDLVKGNYRWGVEGIQGFYKASIRDIELL